MRANRVLKMVFVLLLGCVGGVDGVRAVSSLSAPDGDPANAVYVDDGGNVGIGTTTPGYGLDVETGNGCTYAKFGSSFPLYAITCGHPIIGFNAVCTDHWALGKGSTDHYGGIIGLNPEKGDFFFGVAAKRESNSDSISFTNVMSISKDGNVGLGTESPDSKLTLYDGGPANYLLNVGGSGNGKMKVRHIDGKDWQSSDVDGLYLQYSVHKNTIVNAGGSTGNVGIGTESPQAKLDVVGSIRISDSSGAPVVELGEGLDYAEGFDVSDKNRIEPGSVLIIHPASPGKLAISEKAYDTKVAGIVAGARGVGSGVRLGAGQFDCNVALAGRVYCNVDATAAAIEPGDLLTTSDRLGYAMKGVDYERARGAILGKAMEKLEKGKKGQILVLVTLQ